MSTDRVLKDAADGGQFGRRAAGLAGHLLVDVLLGEGGVELAAVAVVGRRRRVVIGERLVAAVDAGHGDAAAHA